MFVNYLEAIWEAHLNSFCIVSEHDWYLLTVYLCIFIVFLPDIYSDAKHFESILVILFSLFILLFKFVVSYIISFSYSEQTTFSDHKNSFYSVLLQIYLEYCMQKYVDHVQETV